VVEIKDANTPLDQSQRREGNLSPIQQAFKYKPQFKECRFVIATNFYEIRLFQDNQLDYEIFTLKSLASSANNYFELKRFILLLSQDNFVSGRGKSKTEELLAEIRIEQEKITKRFYTEYSDLRLMLMRDIWKNNKEHRNINLVADKAQKILDRIVFVSFCEDTGLLPDNTLHSVYKHAETSVSSVWDTLKGFFHAVDSGSEKLGIPDGYNGGLFHQDAVLDSFKISDDACKALSLIATYDFENELTVNVLGHVFEQSITDLEEIKKKVEPDQTSQKSKRKKDGIFYTPEYIVDFIVQNSLGRYLIENESRIFAEFKLNQASTDKSYKERELKALKAYQDFLHEIKVVDPACGSGAFLVKVFDYLLEENRRIGKRIGSLFDQDEIFREILKNNIFGVDLNEESVRITQLSLWLKTAQKGKKLTYLDKNIRCGNSLIDDPIVAGKKVFNWREEFKDVFITGGFDVVVGNPPYVLSRDSLFNDYVKKYYTETYKTLKDKPNLYILFIEKAITLLKSKGVFGYIVPNSWLGIDSAAYLRKFLLENTDLKYLINIFGQTFSEANVETVILIAEKNRHTNNEVNIANINLETEEGIGEKNIRQIDQNSWLENRNNIFDIVSNEEENNLLYKIDSKTQKLSDLVDVKAGLQAYEVGKGEPKQSKQDLINRIYDAKYQIDENTYKYLEGIDVGRYLLNWSQDWLRYGRFLAQPRSITIFSGKRILIREITGKADKAIMATYLEETFLNNKSIINVVPKEGVDFNFKCLLGILNSSFISFYFHRRSVKANRTLFPKVVVADIKDFPIPIIEKENQDKVANKVDQMLSLNSELRDKTFLAIDLLNSTYKPQSISNAMKTFYLREFDSLIHELEKQKSGLSLSQKEELQTWFNEKKRNLLTIYSNIRRVDTEINTAVYELYKLDEHDINTIESKS